MLVVPQGLLVVLQLFFLLLQSDLPFFNGRDLILKGLQLLQFLLHLRKLSFCLRQKPLFIEAALVFQIPQLLRQIIGCAALVAGGDQLIQPTAEGFVLSHGHFGKLQETRPSKHAPLHTQ